MEASPRSWDHLAFMYRDDRSSNLMFLLSLPFLGAACPGGEGEETTTNNTSVDPTTGGDTEAGTSTSNGSAETSTSNGSAATSTSEGHVDTGTSEGPVDTGNTTGEYEYCVSLPPLMGPVGQACIDQVAKTNECYYDGGLSAECIAYYEAYCQLGIEMAVADYGEACGMAYEELYACLSMLTCEELVDDVQDCPDQSTALEMACMGM